MKYPDNIIGPKFEDGDVIHFLFDGAELTFRAPIVPRNTHGADRVSTTRDFRKVCTQDWDTNDQEHPAIELLSQRWCFEDARTLDDIAQCQVYAGLVECKEEERKANVFLSYPDFENLMIAWHDYTFSQEHTEKYAEDSTWPALPNRYNGRSIPKDHINWFIVELNLSLQVKPVQLAMIPVNNRFVLMIYIDLQRLHYAGRTNPYSEETIKQFERDLLDDFLNHVKIEYSPETIATIQSLQKKTST